MTKKFNGTIKLHVHDSKPDWDAFLADKAPKAAPNVLVILYDDTDCAAWSPYGGRSQMPTMDPLAANGVTYTQWHTTSVCSPTGIGELKVTECEITQDRALIRNHDHNILR